MDIISVDVDPAGDLMLLLGLNDSRKDIRVCSRVLTLASPVFAAMLGSRFAEGQASAQEGWSVGFPDDDADAMLVICRALHFVDNASDDLSHSLLEKVAGVSDKYDLGRALRGWSEVALQQRKFTLINNAGDAALGRTLLNFSFLMESHESFWLASRHLLYFCPAVKIPRAEGFRSPIASLLEGLLDSIQEQRISHLDSIRLAIEDEIQQAVSDPDRENDNTVTHYFHSLNLIGLWPFSRGSAYKSVHEALKATSQYPDCVRFNSCYCDSYNFGHLLQVAIEDLSVEQRGLCLRCVKNRLFSQQEGNCTALRQTECGSTDFSKSLPYPVSP